MWQKQTNKVIDLGANKQDHPTVRQGQGNPTLKETPCTFNTMGPTRLYCDLERKWDNLLKTEVHSFAVACWAGCQCKNKGIRERREKRIG